MLVAVVATTGGGDPRRVAPSTTSTPAAVRPLAPPPLTYRVVYRVETLAAGERNVSTDELWVRRPFGSRLESRAGPPPGGAVRAVTIQDFGFMASTGPNSEPLVVHVAPGVPSGDLRLRAVLDDLASGGRFRPLPGTRRILGRECQRFRSGEPIGTGRLLAPTADEHAEVCIDRDGLLLEETWRVGGEVLRRKRVVEIEVGQPVPDALLQPTAPFLPPEGGGGEIVAVDPASRPPATFWELPTGLAGFTHHGRYLVRPPGAPQEVGASQPDFVVDVFVRGPDFVVIAQGSERGDEPEPTGPVVELGELGEGRLEVGVFGASVLARPDAVRYVRISGTVASSEMVAIASRLEPRPRGELAPLDKEND